MEYIVNLENWNSVFAVPSSVVDNYIKLASGAALKVLLYMLKNNNQPFNLSYIAQALGLSEENVEEAFCFWEQVGVLSKPNSNGDTELPNAQNAMPLPVANAINLVNSPNAIPSPVVNAVNTVLATTNVSDATNPVDTEIVDAENSKKFTQRSSSGFPISPSEISKKLETSQDIKALFSMAEISLGNMLTYTEQRSMVWIYEYVGLKADVILMLLEYCVSIEKTNMHYLETIAISWQENDINTLESAQVEIKRLQESSSFYSKVSRVLGLERKPTSKQREIINTWMEKGYSLDLIEYAYEKTIDNIDKRSFPYINRILEDWYANGLITRNKIDESNSSNPKAKKYKDKTEQSYDLNDLDSLAVNLTNTTKNGG